MLTSELYISLHSINSDVLDIDQGILVVNTCSNLCNYNDLVIRLIKRHGSYEQDLILKTANNTFASINGCTCFAKVTDRLTIASIFSEYLTKFNTKEISWDAVYQGLYSIKNKRNSVPLEPVYVPYKLGSDMSEENWAICMAIIASKIKDAVVVISSTIG